MVGVSAECQASCELSVNRPCLDQITKMSVPQSLIHCQVSRVPVMVKVYIQSRHGASQSCRNRQHEDGNQAPCFGVYRIKVTCHFPVSKGSAKVKRDQDHRSTPLIPLFIYTPLHTSSLSSLLVCGQQQPEASSKMQRKAMKQVSWRFRNDITLRISNRVQVV